MEIKEKAFMTKKDICFLINGKEKPGTGDISQYLIDKIFAKARKEAIEELNKQGMIIPDKSHIPSIYVWRNLKYYGITK